MLCVSTIFGGFEVAAADDALPAPALLPEGKYSETYSLTAYGDGGIVQLQFGITNLGWGSGRGICRLYVQDAGIRTREHRMYSQDEWRASPSPVSSISAPGCSIQAGEKPYFKAGINGTQVLVALERPLKRVSTPQTGLKSPDGAYRSQLLLAASPAAITWTRNGRTNRFNGFAHVDHSLSTLLPSDIAAGWIRFRALGGDTPLIVSARTNSQEDTFTGWQLLGSRLTALQINPPAWWPRSSSGKEVRLANGVIKIGQRIDVFEPLNDLGVLKHAAKLLIGDPRTVLYWADFEGKQGVLEIATQE